MGEQLNVFDYISYQVFLRDFFERKRRKDTRWSYGVWANQLHLKSSSTLIMILKGQRNPGESLIKNMSRYFQFNPAQDEYFENLIRLEKAKNDPRLSVLIMEKLTKHHPKGGSHFLDVKKFRAISNWYYYAIRELVNLAGFVEDSEWISSRLGNALLPREVSNVVKTLIEVGLLSRLPSGSLKLSNQHTSTPTDIADEGLKIFHQQILEKARLCVRDIAPDFREVSGTTFAIKLSNLAKAKDLIRNFRMDLCHLLEEQEADAVFQLEIAFFPLSTIERKMNEGNQSGVSDCSSSAS